MSVPKSSLHSKGRSSQYSVSFRIFHPAINPDDISAELSLIPSTQWKSGDDRRSPNGKRLPGRYKNTYWSYRLPLRVGVNLAKRLDEFSRMLTKHESFLKRLRSTGGRSEFFVGWFVKPNSGEIFDRELLARLSRLQIDLAMDVYGSASSEKRVSRFPSSKRSEG